MRGTRVLYTWLMTASLWLAGSAGAPADDIDIYTRTPPASTQAPLVVLTLDLNVDPLAIVCPDAINGTTGAQAAACSAVQSLLVLPVLENLLGKATNTLLDAYSAVNGLVSQSISLLGLPTTINALTSSLRSITGRTDNALTNVDVVRLALFRLLHQLVGARLAVMLNHRSTCTGAQLTNPRRNTQGCSNGAFVLLAAQEILQSNVDSTLNNVYARLNSIATAAANYGAGAQSAIMPPFQGKELYYELYRYLSGDYLYNAPIDYSDPVRGLRDPAAESGGRYLSPLATACGDVSVLNIMLSNPTLDDDSDTDIRAAFSGVDADSNATVSFDEVALYLRNQGIQYAGGTYSVRSYFLVNDPTNQKPLLSDLVGTAISLPAQLFPLRMRDAGTSLFQPVNAVSTSLLEPLVAYARSDRSVAQPDLFVPLFQPDAQRRPYWGGNLKKLRLAQDSAGNYQVKDALSQSAIDTDGRIKPEALTYWTDANLLPAIQTSAIPGKDGRLVNRGGAAMFVKNPPGTANGSGARLIYYDQNASGALSSLDVNRATVDQVKTDLTASDDLEASLLLMYARGYETGQSALTSEQYQGLLGLLNGLVTGITSLIQNTLNTLLNGTCTLLPILCPPPPAIPPGAAPPTRWMMGDVLHSRPLAIDYGSSVTQSGRTSVQPSLRLFVGTNAGVLHQFRNDAGNGQVAGSEVYSFMPRTVMSILKTQRAAQPIGLSRPYGVDGPPAAYIQDSDGVIRVSDGDKVYLYFGLRRGGKAYYALDVTNPDAAPTLLWRLLKTTAAGSDFLELGQSFSPPRVERMRIRNLSTNQDENKVVLIFGGGYSGGYNSAGNALGKDAQDDGTLGTDDSEGNALFVVDAFDGSLIWKATKGTSTAYSTSGAPKVFKHTALTDSVPSEITTVDSDGDGYVDRAYFGDIGGQVWRADFPASDRTRWQVAPLMNVGRHDQATTADDRRFFERPDYVRVNRGTESYDAVVISSGNREDPLGRTVVNWLYVMRDGATVPTITAPGTRRHSDFADLSSNCLALGSCSNPAGLTTAGWKMRLGPVGDNSRVGEKGITTPTTVGGNILFETYVPPYSGAPVCTPQEGTSRTYAVYLPDASPSLSAYAADGDNDARSTLLRASGMGNQAHWIAPSTFIRSDFTIQQVGHSRFFRSFWREKLGE